MTKIPRSQLEQLNNQLMGTDPAGVIAWVLKRHSDAVITTNFRPYEAALLHAVTTVAPEIPVIWCDTGYNTPQTYAHAEDLRERLRLNLHLYVPLQTAAYRDALMGIPGIDDPRHARFTEEVKLEPFRRAMAELRPSVWFTNLRKGQTALRDRLDILSLSHDGILKVSPFYHWTDNRLDEYLEAHGLPNEFRYFDPTKVLQHRECGLHR